MFRMLLQSVLRLSPEMASGRIRIPSSEPGVEQRLEFILRCFIDGYNLAITAGSNADLASDLDASFDPHHVGFAYEGAGMGLALLDLVSFSQKSRLHDFIHNDGARHDYIAMVGAGFTMARLPFAGSYLRRYFRRFDPLVCWCVPDGYGFHEGFFAPARFVDAQQGPSLPLSQYDRQLFNSGVGRSLWWTCGASPRAISDSIAGFSAEHRAEMWCGIGVACAYAGGDEGRSLATLLELAGDYRADFLSGLPFAARMRQKGGNPSPVTENACQQLLSCSTDEAANMAAAALQQASALLGDRVGDEGYAFVRRQLTEILTREAVPHGELSEHDQ
jgi:hypothetical protein